MPQDRFDLLLREINHYPGTAPQIEGLPPSETKALMEAVNTMYQIRAYADVPIEEFTSDICDALLEYEQLTQDQVSRFRERLGKILASDALSIAAKAVVLLGEHEHLFCSARVITDARPVYGRDVASSPDAMVITHTLKLDYHGVGGKIDEIYIGLGSNDVRELRNVLERAEEKAKSLQATLEAARIKFIDPQKD